MTQVLHTPIGQTESRTRILHVVTSSVSLTLMKGQLRYLSERGFEVFVASSPGPELEATSGSEKIEAIPITIAREISPLRDIGSLFLLCRLMQRIRPAITNVGTPKAGLLGGLAAFLTRVPCRIYTLRGLRAETATGLKRAILLAAEWIACRCAHQVICVSQSLREKVVDLGVVPPNRAVVLGHGSSNGVDCDKFGVDSQHTPEARALRASLGIPNNAPVIGFVGRLTRDKGIAELSEAHARLKQHFPGLRLLILGDFETGDPIESSVRTAILSDPLVIHKGSAPDTAPYYRVMDILALPTYREGFPNVALEAQASGIPVVTTTATGAVDSVRDGITGSLVPAADAVALATSLGALLSNSQARRQMGNAAAEWVRNYFRRESLWEALNNKYNQLLKEKSLVQRQSGVRSIVKSVFDRAASGVLLIGLAPILVVLAGLVRLKLGGPIFFRQRRPGQGGKILELVKFRTMTDERDADGRLLSDQDRLTSFGRRMRSLSVDELPQLWNVLLGDISFVGPRPLLVEYLNRYTPEQARRHLVKPGITGWAQVNGRNGISWEEKFALDTWYVDHWSLWLDMKILGMTAWRAFRREGISQDGHATMPVFMGSEADRREP